MIAFSFHYTVNMFLILPSIILWDHDDGKTLSICFLCCTLDVDFYGEEA